MKKLLILLGIGVGIVAGSRLGRGPYEKLRGTARDVAGRPEVTKVVDAMSDKVDDVTDKVATKVDVAGAKLSSKTASVKD
jgi:hypothetical protein